VAGLCLILSITPASATTIINKDIEIYKVYTHIKVGNHKQYNCINKLWTLESNWNPLSKNKKSSAMGIPQLLNMKETNPYLQIDLGLKYIDKRYSNDGCKALSFFLSKGYY
jgi:hypothetical protein